VPDPKAPPPLTGVAAEREIQRLTRRSLFDSRRVTTSIGILIFPLAFLLRTAMTAKVGASLCAFQNEAALRRAIWGSGLPTVPGVCPR
jgi:hypothetical protein